MIPSGAASRAPSSVAPTSIRIVSYNILSSQLASPNHFTTLNPQHLNASYRFPRILEKLQDEMDKTTAVVTAASASSTSNNSSNNKIPTIFCLQEVSQDWAGPLHAWFANRGYTFITSLYGKKFNGYMGIGLAYPSQENMEEHLKLLNVDIVRLSDTRSKWPKPPKQQQQDDDEKKNTLVTLVQTTHRFVWKMLVTLPLKLLQVTRDTIFSSGNNNEWKRQDEDHWSLSQRRFNTMIVATFCTANNAAFCVGNYHMPCCYYSPMTMTIHSDMAARHVQNVATQEYKKLHQEDNVALPFILAGDFNFDPTSPQYKLLTTAWINPAESEAFPTPKFGTTWSPGIKHGMVSAYAQKDGSEPDFTNYARIQEEEPFINTLDYLFLSSSSNKKCDWIVHQTKPLVHRNVAQGPYPNAVEPSDHVLISADLTLNK